MKPRQTSSKVRRLSRIHAYPASFGEDLASDLMNRFSEEQEQVLDPFSGGATVLLQARKLNRSATGIDVDPVAHLIGRVVSRRYSAQSLERFGSEVSEMVEKIEAGLSSAMVEQAYRNKRFSVDGIFGQIPEHERIDYWFAPVHQVTLASLVALADRFDAPKQRDILHLAISSSIVRKWPNTISHARDVDHSRPHRVERSDLTVGSGLAIFRRVFGGIVRYLGELSSPSAGVRLRAKRSDALVALRALPSESVDYVLTSPPYFNAIDYPRAHQFTEWWLWPRDEGSSRSKYVGLRPGMRTKEEIDASLALVPSAAGRLQALKDTPRFPLGKLCRYIWDVNGVLEQTYRILRPGRTITLVLANNSIKKVTVPIVPMVVEMLQRAGFDSVSLEEREIDSSRRRYPYGIRGFTELMRTEYLIHAKK